MDRLSLEADFRPLRTRASFFMGYDRPPPAGASRGL
jgi:hypothetical protein